MRGLDFSQVVKSGEAGSVAPADRPQIVAEFFACSPNSRSYEWKEKRRGYFSYFLEQGLHGGAAVSTGSDVSLDRLKRYLATVVPAAVRNNEVGKEQIPTGNILGPLDAGDFVVATAGTVAPISPVVSPIGSSIDTVAHVKVIVNAPDATVMLDGKPIVPGQEASPESGAG